MKKLLCMIISAVMLCTVLATVSFAKTADTVYQSVEGTAVIDGVKDDAYANALALSMVQTGKTNGGGKVLETPMATVYIINDAEWVYVFFEVTDDQLDSSNPNNWEQDSVEIYYMEYNIGKQVRFLLDGTPIVNNNNEVDVEVAFATTDIGYNAEVKFPICDVLNNQVETCVQINQCTDGIRQYTVFAEGHTNGDEAWQRSKYTSRYDAWWTLALAGEHEDTRTSDARAPMEMNNDNYLKLRDITVSASLTTQNRVSYNDYQVLGAAVYANVGQTVDFLWTDLSGFMNYTADTTANFTTAPFFNVVLGDASMPADTNAKYHFTYSDITIKAEGYDDVVFPGGKIEEVFEPTDNGSYVSGNTASLDLVTTIATTLDLTTEEVCTYLTNVTEVSGSLTFVAYEGRNVDDLNKYAETMDAEDVAKLAEIEYLEAEVANAEAVFANEEATLEEKEAAYRAANSKVKETSFTVSSALPKTNEFINGLVTRVDNLKLALEEAKAAVETEAPVTEAPEVEEPAVEEPTTEAPAEGGLNLGLILGILAAVVAVAIVVVILIPGKKKK
ncbi:MAG: hypothetical protein IKU89_01690 [Oscillospiraceae bacterium]|nr:hypothetical protein [Oscillospiraceae bacterium]